MRKAWFAVVALIAISAALAGTAEAACRNCWIGGVIYGYTPAYYYTLYGPPNPDRWVRSPYNWTGPNFSFIDYRYYSGRRPYARRAYRM